MQVAIDDLVLAIRALSEAEHRRRSPFHLAVCAVCKAPTFQYPCPNCRSWADHSDTEVERHEQLEAAATSGVGTREAFVRRVEAAGGLGPWYFADRLKVVACDPGSRGYDPAFHQSVLALIDRAKTIQWPDAGEVWDDVTNGTRLFPPTGFHGDRCREFEERAVSEFGEDGVACLKARPEKRPGAGRSWPENCDEGRDLVKTMAEEALEGLGLGLQAVPVAPGSR